MVARPVLALRQTGFALERTEILADTDLAAEASPLAVLATRTRAAVEEVKRCSGGSNLATVSRVPWREWKKSLRHIVFRCRRNVFSSPAIREIQAQIHELPNYLGNRPRV